MTEIVYNRNGVPFDIDNIATDLNGKADCDLTNVNDTGTAKVANWGMPSDVYDDITVGASDSTYTAPADGFLNIVAYTSTACYFFVTYDGTEYVAFQDSGYGNASCFLPMRTGTNYSIEYSGVESWRVARFYYAEGTKGEA